MASVSITLTLNVLLTTPIGEDRRDNLPKLATGGREGDQNKRYWRARRDERIKAW